MERLKNYVGLLKGGFPLDEGAFLNCHNHQPEARETSAVAEPCGPNQAILPLDEDSVASPAQVRSWFF